MARNVGRWPPLARSLTSALTVLGLGGFAIVAVELVLVLSGGVEPSWVVALFPVLGGVYLATGLLAWRRRPRNGVGAVLVTGGGTWFLAGLANSGVGSLTAVGLVSATTPLAAVVHLLHVFPSGRLQGAVSRSTVAAGYVVSVLLQAPGYLFTVGPGPVGVLAVADRPDLARLGHDVQSMAGAVVMAVTAAVLIRRIAGVDRSRRRVLAPLFAYGVFTVLSVPVGSSVLRPMLDIDPVTFTALQLCVIGGVPVAFVISMLRGGFAFTIEFDELATWLGTEQSTRSSLAGALADALGDDSVQLVFWLSERDCYVDAGGAPVDLSQDGSHRRTAEVVLAGRRVGAIVYDASLIADPALVDTAGRVIAFAVDHERLTAELLASQEALRASLVRVVGAGDAERRRIAQDLHDGLQVQLVLLALRARMTAAGAPGPVEPGGASTDLGSRIDQAAADLRRFVHGVMPAVLIERGLGSATKALVDEMPIPTRLTVDGLCDDLPGAVQYSSYLIISEALTNAVKHSGATRLSVQIGRADGHLHIDVQDDGEGGARVGPGAGLMGLTDRVTALGGRLRLDSPVGHGTRLHVEVPCAS